MDIGQDLTASIPLSFILDTEEGIRACGRGARTTLRDADLGQRSRPRIVGQLRTGMIEQCLLNVARSYGASCSECGSVEGTDVYLYQTHVRLGTAVVVRASIQAPASMPTQNKSRKKLLEKLNKHIDAYNDLFNPVPLTRVSEVTTAVFILVCPNRMADDGIGEIAIAVVDSRHSELRFYESFEIFKGRYAPAAVEVIDAPVVRRGQTQPFIAPEEGAAQPDEKKSG